MEEISLRIPGETPCGGGRIFCSPAKDWLRGEGTLLTQTFDAAALRGAVVRARREGDRFHPLGASGGKKLKDWFIDKKIPAELRDGIPLVARGSEILWVVGYAIAEQAKVRADSTHLVQCKFEIN